MSARIIIYFFFVLWFQQCATLLWMPANCIRLHDYATVKSNRLNFTNISTAGTDSFPSLAIVSNFKSIDWSILVISTNQSISLFSFINNYRKEINQYFLFVFVVFSGKKGAPEASLSGWRIVALVVLKALFPVRHRSSTRGHYAALMNAIHHRLCSSRMMTFRQPHLCSS